MKEKNTPSGAKLPFWQQLALELLRLATAALQIAKLMGDPFRLFTSHYHLSAG